MPCLAGSTASSANAHASLLSERVPVALGLLARPGERPRHSEARDLMRPMTLSSTDAEAVEGYFRDWDAWLGAAAAADGLQKPEWRRREPPPPIAAMQEAALHHPNPRVRRACLNTLDHYANDASADVFRHALRDPVPRVRAIALHGLACERCRTGELCVSDVVPSLISVLEQDRSAKVRHDAVGVLLRLSARDASAGEAIVRAAREDADPLVRQVATAAVEGRHRDIRSRKTMRRRARRAQAA